MHVSPMLTLPCAPRVLRSGDDVYHFDRACREGLPSQLLRATTSLQKATAASRYLSALLSEFLPIDEATAFAAALVESRYAPLAAELQCDLQPPCEGGGIADAAAQAGAEDVAVARRVAAVLRERDPRSNGVGQIVLQDYLEHVAGYAVGMQRLCGFVKHCLA